jgi:hypothetical protein
MNFFYKIDYGFGYMLRRIRIKYPDINPCAGVTAFPAWAPATLYVTGNVVYDTSSTLKNPSLFLCTTGGTSGGAIPVFNHKRLATTADGIGTLVWTAYDLVKDFGDFVKDLELEILDNANNNPRQPSPLKVDLLSSPGKSMSYYRNAPSPVDNAGYGINFSSNQTFFSSTLNFLYRYNDLISLTFSNISTVTQVIGPTGAAYTVPAFFSPSYIDVVLEGYYVPEKAFDLWQGARI